MHSDAVFNWPTGWEAVFNAQGVSNDLRYISDKLKQEEKTHNILPYPEELYRALEGLKPEDVKVVIIGQDPYPNTNPDGTPQANGLAFSTRPGTPLPGSLRNIFKEVQSNYPSFKMPNDGDLTPWKNQGVLLLNACLTVRYKEIGSHKQLWFGIIQRIIEAVCEANHDCIFVLWGKKSQVLQEKIRKNGGILTAAHPSNLSARRGFFGCQHFKQINDILAEKGYEQISWHL